jgi:type I restriction enzyme S subunit
VIADLKPYEAYKDSDHDWLASIPAHWGLLRAKHLFREVDERSSTGKEELLSVSHLTGVTPRRLKNVTMFMAESNVGHKVCRPDDLVINTLWAWMGALGMTRHHGIVSPAYGVYRPVGERAMLSAYAGLLLRTPLYAAEYQRRSTGVNSSRLRLYPEQFLRIPLLVPPPEEQAAIVRFLDWANGRLERAIRAKRQVIALLNEQKQAIIHRAVTRGLDPSVPLKQSGMPWLGEIPEHWDVRQMRHVGYLLKGTGGTKEDAVVTGVPCVRYGELYTAYRNFIRKTRTFVTPSRALQYTSIQYGDVLFAASGEKIDEIGKSAVNLMVEPAVCGGDIVILRPTAAAHAPFLGYACDSHQAAHQKATMCRGTTIKHIYPDELRGLQICFPPIEEQQKIAMALDANLLELNDTVGRMENEIILLREYRARLIADVVTGQLDVREAATHVPDDVALSDLAEAPDDIDEPETADEEAIS